MRENLIGLTQILRERGNDWTSSLSAIDAHQSYFQLSVISRRLSILARSDTIATNQLMHLIEITHANMVATGVLQSTISARHEFEACLLSLKLGLLPSSIVPFEKLHQILTKIEDNLPPEYQLAIPLEGIDSYYLLSLTRFAVSDNHLQIRLSVPLVKTDVGERKVTFFQPIARPFVAPRPSTFNLVLKASERTQLWAWDTKTGDAFEANMHDWICHNRGMQSMCYSYHPYGLKAPRKCFGVLAAHRFDRITQGCTFEVTDEPYQPIHLSNGTYIVHSNPRNRSFDVLEHCSQGPPTKLVLDPRRQVNVVELEPGCFLTMADVIQGGPTSPLDQDELSIAGGFMALTSLNTSFPELDSEPNGTAPASNLTRVKLVYDNERLSRIAENIQAGTERIKARLYDFENDKLLPSVKSGPFAGWVVFEILWEVSFTALVFGLLMAVVRQGQWMYFLAPVLVIRQNGVQAVDITSLYSSVSILSPVSILPDYDLTYLLSCVRWVICAVCTFCAIYWSVWRRVYLSTHTASTVATGQFRFWLQVTLNITRHTLLGQFEQLIIIRVPVKNTLPAETACLEVSRPCFLYCINHGLDLLKSIEPITVRGKFQDGTFSCALEEPLQIDLSRISWDNSHPPEGLSQTSYGLAQVTPIGDPTPI